MGISLIRCFTFVSIQKNNYEIYIPQKKYTFIDMNDFKKYTITNDISLEENLKKLGIILN